MASIDKRANGRYLARWREYPGAPQKTRTFRRKKDAERFLGPHSRGSGPGPVPRAVGARVDESVPDLVRLQDVEIFKGKALDVWRRSDDCDRLTAEQVLAARTALDNFVAERKQIRRQRAAAAPSASTSGHMWRDRARGPVADTLPATQGPERPFSAPFRWPSPGAENFGRRHDTRFAQRARAPRARKGAQVLLDGCCGS